MYRARLILLLVAGLCKPSVAAWWRGTIKVPANGIVFLAKFCFDYDPNSFRGNPIGVCKTTLSSADAREGSVKIALLDDQRDSYSYSQTGSVEWLGGCDDEKLNSAAKIMNEVNVSDTQPVSSSVNVHERVRPRMWYVALVDCSGQDRTIEYQVHMTNPKLGSLEELSMDSFSFTGVGFFLVVYVGLSLAQVFAVLKRSNAPTKHPLRLMLTLSIVCAMIGMTLFLLNLCWFKYRGEDHPTVYLAAKMLKSCSKYTLLCICLLVSQGRSISLPFQGKNVWHAFRIISPICLANLILEMWGEYAQSRKYTTDSVYCTPVGAIIITSDICLVLAYLRNICRSAKEEIDATKQRFYYTWGMAYSIAFLSLPVSVLVAQEVAPWVRTNIGFLVSNAIHSVLLTLLVFGLWPERSQSFFCIDRQAATPQTFGIKSELLMEEIAHGEFEAFSQNGDRFHVTSNA
eukprot:TRINITY_DN2543_c0_g1_i1.p1 TRINITY_DN2543_c0_g1~~TRINITY_DN2543_c0_g1_i1.p1  ORF type:complete len:458 (+),score=45.56 TRINITY_DN2543_c0_g1_i1:46-1419(+)